MTREQWAKFEALQAKQKHSGDPLDENERMELAALQTIVALKFPDWNAVMVGQLWSRENPYRGHVLTRGVGCYNGIANNELHGEIAWR